MRRIVAITGAVTLAVIGVAVTLAFASDFRVHKPWVGNYDDGPTADVAQVNAIQRKHFGYLLESYSRIFTIVEGEWAVNASNLGEGWTYRIYRKRGSSWRSPVFVSPEACSIRTVGVPDDIAATFDRKLHDRIDLERDDAKPCWEGEPDTMPDQPATAPRTSPSTS